MYEAKLVLAATRPEDLLACTEALITTLCGKASCIYPDTRAWLVASTLEDDCSIKMYQFRRLNLHEIGLMPPYAAAVEVHCEKPGRLVEAISKLRDAAAKCRNAILVLYS